MKDNHQALNQERPPSLKHTQDQEIQKSAVVPSSTGRDLSASLSKMPFADEDSFERHQETPQHPDVPSRDSKVQKSFHLDSESECADDLISGPSIGRNPEGDDSDSFWN